MECNCWHWYRLVDLFVIRLKETTFFAVESLYFTVRKSHFEKKNSIQFLEKKITVRKSRRFSPPTECAIASTYHSSTCIEVAFENNVTVRFVKRNVINVIRTSSCSKNDIDSWTSHNYGKKKPISKAVIKSNVLISIL